MNSVGRERKDKHMLKNARLKYTNRFHIYIYIMYIIIKQTIIKGAFESV